jgi:hypothetical protein
MKSAGDCIVLIFILLLAAITQETASGKMAKISEQMPVVVFVCEHGSAECSRSSSFQCPKKKRPEAVGGFARHQSIEDSQASKGLRPMARRGEGRSR